MTDAITFARAIDPPVSLSKRIKVRGATIVGVEPSPNAFLFEFREQPVRHFNALAVALENAAAQGEIAVRGTPRAPAGRRAIYHDEKRGPPGLDVVPRRWVGFDWDGLPLDPIPAEPIPEELAEDPAESCNWLEADPLLDPEVGARHALRRLPPAFRDASCVWQVSASAGFKPGFRLRTWHWFDYPITGAELKSWLRPAIERHLVDDVTLREAQPHYLAVRIGGGPDPCPCRFGFLQQARDIVAVPDIEGIRRRQDERERRARAAQTIHVSDLVNGRDYAERRLKQCVAAVRNAPDGTKHPNDVEQTTRAKAICDRHGLDWSRWREELRSTYEATLPTGEAKRRRRGSTDGVLGWIERRAS
jgi:hypothetical protein